MKQAQLDVVRKRIQWYCVYRDRCKKEVAEKLIQLGLKGKQLNDVVIELIEQDFLNEERFARSFVRGKFRYKKWGKNKLVQRLRLLQVEESLIDLALTEINDLEYAQVLKDLVVRKAKEWKGEEKRSKRAKVVRYLLSKGYESERVWQTVKDQI